MIYFTSDLHFCHPFVAATRGFRPKCDNMNELIHTVGESEFAKMTNWRKHDETVVRHINARVGKQDELYVLGDLSCGSRDSFEQALRMIDKLYVPPSRRHLILGNHENFKVKDSVRVTLAHTFGYVSVCEYLYVDGVPIVLSHVPLLSDMDGRVRRDLAENSYSKSMRRHAVNVPSGTLHLHGHTHSPTPRDSRNALSVNVGLDAWGLFPVSLPQILCLKPRNSETVGSLLTQAALGA